MAPSTEPVAPPSTQPGTHSDQAMTELERAQAIALAAQQRSSSFGEPAPLKMSDPWRWLVLGWQDFMHAKGLGLFYGVIFVLMAYALWTVFERAPAYLLALSADFLLMGPFLCLGMYQTSRRLSQGRRVSFRSSIFAWRTKTATMAIFAAVLLVMEMVWARASLVVFALSFDAMPDFKGSLTALVNPDNLQFILTYLAVAWLFGTLIFALSVVSMPMILDRKTDAISAALTSVRVCLSAPLVMAQWALMIALLVFLAMAPYFLGLLVVAPVLGHASWHAYQAALLPATPAEADPLPDAGNTQPGILG